MKDFTKGAIGILALLVLALYIVLAPTIIMIMVLSIGKVQPESLFGWSHVVVCTIMLILPFVAGAIAAVLLLSYDELEKPPYRITVGGRNGK